MRHLLLAIAVTLLALGVVLFAVRKGELPSAAAGRALYEANGCRSCHGPSGHGDGLLAATLSDKPIDLRDATAFRQGASEDAIAETLVDDPLMPKFDHLTDTERRSLALYVISIRTHNK